MKKFRTKKIKKCLKRNIKDYKASCQIKIIVNHKTKNEGYGFIKLVLTQGILFEIFLTFFSFVSTHDASEVFFLMNSVF